MDRIETQMRELTGRVEEVMNQVDQVRQRIEQINSDLERAHRPSAGRAGPVASAAPPARRPGRGRLAPHRPGRLPDLRRRAAWPAATIGRGPLLPPGADDAARRTAADGRRRPRGGPTPIFGTLTPPGPRRRPLAGAGQRAAAGTAGRRHAAGRLGHRAVQSCLRAV